MDVVDLREDQPWLMVPKAALDALANEVFSFPGDLPVKEAGEKILELTESFLAKLLLNRGHGLGMLYGYRRELERRAQERSFAEGVEFALHVLRRFADSREDTHDRRLEGD